MDDHGFTRDSLKTKSITCDVCEKSFKYKSYLVRHKRAYTGEKSYKCDVCESKFSLKYNLIVHKKVIREKDHTNVIVVTRVLVKKET